MLTKKACECNTWLVLHGLVGKLSYLGEAWEVEDSGVRLGSGSFTWLGCCTLSKTSARPEGVRRVYTDDVLGNSPGWSGTQAVQLK